MAEKHPRLLVLTEFPPNASGGGPAVVRQMLKDWPPEELYWWSCSPEGAKRFGQEVREARSASIPTRLYPQRKLAALKSCMLERIWTPYATSHLQKMLREVKPDALWVIPHNWSIPPIHQVLLGHSKTAPEPGYHVTMQDYLDVHHNPQRFGEDRCQRMAAMADRLYASASSRDATSHPMIEDLRQGTGADAAQMLHAGLERADLEFLENKATRERETIRIAYAGTILVEEVFEHFVSLLEAIRPVLSKPLELCLLGAHSYGARPWFNPGWMKEMGNLPEPVLLETLRDCDWGFAPMALTDEDPRYNRFSFPTKFITYLAAGLPVITLGHPESSVVKMARLYEVGPCANTPDELGPILEVGLRISSPWNQYGSEIRRCARTEFDAEKMRRELYRCLEGEPRNR